jgi:hypothetical protein
VSEQHPGSAGDQHIPPPAGQGFPPPPQYPEEGTTPAPGYQPGQPPAQPYNPNQPPAPGYPSGSTPAPGYPSGSTPAPGYPGGAPVPGYPSGSTPAAGYPSGGYQSGGAPVGGYGPGQAPGGGYPGQGPLPSYQEQYGGGNYSPPGGPPFQNDYLGSGPTYAPQPRKRRRGMWSAVAAGTVVLVAGASFAAYTLVSGGGTTLDKKVPADSVAYAEINLDPPAGQKLAALRYLKHFPDLKVNDNANTLLDGLLDNIFPSPEDRQKFTSDVQPWLGKHAAVAADPQGNQIKPVIIVEATSTDKAKSGLADLSKQMHFGYVVADGTVTIAETQQIAQQAADDAGKSALSGTGTYQDDVKQVGGNDGVITGWANFEAAAKYIPQSSQSGTSLDTLKGVRIAMSLKFTDTVADLTLKTFGGKAPQGATGAIGDKVAKLPEDTAVALGFSGGDQLVRQAYDALQKAGLSSEIDDALGKYDLQLPDDIATLVGSQTVVAVGGSADNVQGGVITKTSDPNRAREVAERILSDVDSSVQVVQQQTSDGLALASSQDYLAKLTAGGGLGNTDGYKQAVPDAGSAQYVGYVDLQRTFALSNGEVPQSARALKAVGVTASYSGNTGTLHIRVVVG